MFEILAYGYASTLWAVSNFFKAEKNTIKSLSDPGTFISGAVAGGAARMLTLSVDQGGAKGVKQTVLRRMPQMGCLLLFYTNCAAQQLPGTETQPRTKMAATFLLASCAGFNMRFVCNPISRIGDESIRTGSSAMSTIKTFKSKTILQFWYCGPNLVANALYFGVLLTTFEGLRRFTERNFISLAPKRLSVNAEEGAGNRGVSFGTYTANAGINFVCGGLAAGFASTVCYPYSAHRYMQTVIHDSALCRGLAPTLLKEVPQIAVAFGIFSLLQPILSPRHGVRCGFGY